MAVSAFILLVVGLAVCSTVFWIWMLVDCLTHETNQGNEKIIWILVILFAHVLGATMYYFARRKERMAMVGRP